MKLLIRGAVIIGLAVGLMAPVPAQDNTVEDTAGNTLQVQPESAEPLPQDSEGLPDESEVLREKAEVLREKPEPTPEAGSQTLVEEFLDRDIDWLAALAGGGIALLLAQLIGLMKSRRESHQELQMWFTKWSVEECV